MEQAPLVNRVAASGLITLDLAQYLPKEKILVFDLKDHLVQGQILMEKPFRAALKELDWTVYTNAPVAVTCSADAIIPKWAYMLVATYLQQQNSRVYYGTVTEVENTLLLTVIEQLDADAYNDARVVVKGCGERDIPAEAYLAISNKLLPVVKSLMYGEPCSTVPVYKRPKSTEP